ncbi:hypothetical protein D3C71_1018000 [compost metagenome]
MCFFNLKYSKNSSVLISDKLIPKSFNGSIKTLFFFSTSFRWVLYQTVLKSNKLFLLRCFNGSSTPIKDERYLLLSIFSIALISCLLLLSLNFCLIISFFSTVREFAQSVLFPKPFESLIKSRRENLSVKVPVLYSSLRFSVILIISCKPFVSFLKKTTNLARFIMGVFSKWVAPTLDSGYLKV